MKKVIGALIIVGVVALVLVGTSRQADERQTEAVRIGAILPMTGDLAFLGEEMQKGMELALSENPDVAIELIVEDDAGLDSGYAVSALQKMIQTDDIEILLNPTVNTVKSLAPIVDTHSIPTLVFWDTNAAVRGLSPNIFAMGFSTEAAGEDMAQFAFDELGVRSVAVIGNIDEWSDVISDAYKTRFTSLGGEIVSHEQIAVGDLEVRTVVSKAVAANPDAVYIPVFPDAAVVLTRQLRQLGYTGHILSGDGFLDITIAELGEDAEGVYATQLWIDNDNFVDAYVARYGTSLDAVNYSYPAMGYDVMNVAIEAVRTAGERENYREVLDGLHYQGVMHGGVLATDSAGKREEILKVENGVFIRISE